MLADPKRVVRDWFLAHDALNFTGIMDVSAQSKEVKFMWMQ